jgi:hypothetical protein
MIETWYAAGLPPYSMMNFEPPIGSHSVKSKSLASSAPNHARDRVRSRKVASVVRGGPSVCVVTVHGVACRDDSGRDARAFGLKVPHHLLEPVLLVCLLVQPEAGLLKVCAHAVEDGDVVHRAPVQHAPVGLGELSGELRQRLLLQPPTHRRMEEQAVRLDVVELDEDLL